MEPDLFDVLDDARAGHDRELELFAAVLKQMAFEAMEHGVTIQEARLRAERKGILRPHRAGDDQRRLSWIQAAPKRAGLVAKRDTHGTVVKRMSPDPKTRNAGTVWILATYATGAQYDDKAA